MNQYHSIRRVLFALWLLAFPLLLVFWYYPVTDQRTRMATLVVAVFLLAGSLAVAGKRKLALGMLIVIYGAFATFVFWPSALPAKSEGLRSGYARALASYEGSRYVWGGEGCFGIDCSGLVRKGMEDALVEQGLLNFNPALIREGASLYWNDTTAKVIGEGYAGRTHLVTSCKSLNLLDYALLQIGDLAVTTRGEHVMAYLGAKTWIAADPGEGKVTRFVIPEKANGYFPVPMRIVRWKILSD